jgi:hypothetical protein
MVEADGLLIHLKLMGQSKIKAGASFEPVDIKEPDWKALYFLAATDAQVAQERIAAGNIELAARAIERITSDHDVVKRRVMLSVVSPYMFTDAEP